MAVINILIENSYDFIDNNTGFYVSENNYVDITLQDSQEYLVSWKSPLAENDFTYTCIAKEYENSIYLGNFTLLNLPFESDFDSLPFLLQITNGYLTIYTTDFSSNIYSIAIDQFIDTSENIVIRDPLGNEVVYGEYDIVTLAVDNVSKKEINYYKLPSLEDDEKNKILISQEGLWSKTEFPQPDWAENDPTAPSFIKNKPEKFISEQANWNEEDPEAQGYIINKPSLKDFQADWNETDSTKYGYIHNKPQALGADWNAEEGEPGYIANKPDSFVVEQEQANWNQTNSLKNNFIQNKPFGFYDDIVNNSTYTFTPSEYDSTKYICKTTTFIPENIIDGEECIVHFDGVSYTVPYRKYSGTTTAPDGSVGTNISVPGIGNPQLITVLGITFVPDDTSTADCPFFIDDPHIFASTSGEHTVYCRRKNNIKILDKKFLPDLQSDWSSVDVDSSTYINNKPFGEVPPVIAYGTNYYFYKTSVDNIYEGTYVKIQYIPEKNENIRVVWEANYGINYTVKEYDFNDPDPDSYSSIKILGLGNPNLMLLNGQLLTYNGYQDKNSTAPFFIDFNNKKIYSNISGEIKISAYLYDTTTLYSDRKYINNDYLKGELLPYLNKNVARDNDIMVVSDGEWIRSQMPHSIWTTTNPLLGSYIENKPFGENGDILSGGTTLEYDESTDTSSGFFVALCDLSYLKVNNKYDLIVNGVLYKDCICYQANTYVDYEGFFFGNTHIFEENNLPEKFIQHNDDTHDFFFLVAQFSEDTSEIENYKGSLGVAYHYGNISNVEVIIKNNGYKKIEGKYLPLDKTLTKPNYAAEAAAVGNLVAEFQSIIEEQNTIIAQLRSQVYNLSVRLDALDGGSSTPGASVVGETLIVEGSENNEGLILTYGYVDNETLTFDVSSGSAAVTEDELNVSGSVDTTDDTLNASGVVTTDGVWEV